MKKILLILTASILFFITPLQSFAALSNPSPSVPKTEVTEDSHTFELEGKVYTLTLVTEEGTQTAYIEHENGEVESVSYNQTKDELRFNGELADAELFVEMKEAADELGGSDTEYSSDEELSSQFETFSNYNWKHVKSYKNSFNVKLFTVLAITGIILLLPTGSGALMGVVLTAKIISVLAASIFSASQQSKYYYTFDTYYSPLNGYYNNKFVMRVYKDSKRTKLIKSVSHTTRMGKKY
ncbi:hypothetical protein [Cytobacillus purgationiresistens]|uniref:Uncharacterized protein n=1 Tax=Cytobacillus purgationiresistens TaxID=863449 RepID=A0ABU0AJ18_9BACI|nr:hypothetical protein [Cytobacillus purgationiresistens]MDQ0271259.1 hypothetical protein [Cytobacillus purgationiresistens]